MAFIAYNNGIGGINTDTPKEALRELLIKKTRTAGHALTFDEAKSDPTMVDPNVYAFYFGHCFSDIAMSAWSTVTKPTMKIVKRKGNGMRNSKYNAEKVKNTLRDYYKKHHHWPTQVEATASDELPAYGTILKYCGDKSGWYQLIFGDGADDDCPSAEAAPAPATTPIEEEDNVSSRDDVAPTKVIIAESVGDPIAEFTVDETPDHQVNIELKIKLPDREKPIAFSLSF